MPLADTMTPDPLHLTLELEADDSSVQALAQFVKRVGWQEFRQCAVSDEEAYQIRAGVEALQSALAKVGYAPR